MFVTLLQSSFEFLIKFCKNFNCLFREQINCSQNNLKKENWQQIRRSMWKKFINNNHVYKVSDRCAFDFLFTKISENSLCVDI